MNDNNKSLFQEEIATWNRHNAIRHLTPLEHDGDYVILGNKRLLNLSRNDYLGLAAKTPISLSQLSTQSFSGSTSSPLLTGYSIQTERLEQQLATDYQRESALVFNSGYHMNTGICGSLCNQNTLIIADKLVHASIIDGIKLTGLPFIRFRHNDLNHLEKILETKASSAHCIIVIVESLYSMDGDVCDLRSLVEIKKRYPQTILYVDEAHAVGVRGIKGLGLAEETGTIKDIDILCGTFGKALASMGGYVVCDQVIKTILVNKCRSLIYSTALPPLLHEYTYHLWNHMKTMTEARKSLNDKSALLRQKFVSMDLPMPSESHIIPWIIGANDQTIALAEQLQNLGFYVLPIRPPTVPIGKARLRFSLTASMPIEPLLTAINKLS